MQSPYLNPLPSYMHYSPVSSPNQFLYHAGNPPSHKAEEVPFFLYPYNKYSDHVQNNLLSPLPDEMNKMTAFPYIGNRCPPDKCLAGFCCSLPTADIQILLQLTFSILIYPYSPSSYYSTKKPCFPPTKTVPLANYPIASQKVNIPIQQATG